MGNTSKIKQGTAYMIFAALSEVMLEMYNNITLLNQYSPSLHNKLKNLRADFERTSVRLFKLFPEEEHQQTLFGIMDIFEKLLKYSTQPAKFAEIIAIIRAWDARNEKELQNEKTDLPATDSDNESSN